MTETTEQQDAAPSPQDRPLFRPEAVAYHLSGRRGPQRKLDLEDKASTWAFLGLVVALALALVAAFTVHADETANGAAVVLPADRHYAALLMTDVSISRLRIGQRVVLELPDGRTVVGRIATSGSPYARFDQSLDLSTGVPVKAAVRLSRRSIAEIVTGRGR